MPAEFRLVLFFLLVTQLLSAWNGARFVVQKVLSGFGLLGTKFCWLLTFCRFSAAVERILRLFGVNKLCSMVVETSSKVSWTAENYSSEKRKTLFSRLKPSIKITMRKRKKKTCEKRVCGAWLWKYNYKVFEGFLCWCHDEQFKSEDSRLKTVVISWALVSLSTLKPAQIVCRFHNRERKKEMMMKSEKVMIQLFYNWHRKFLITSCEFIISILVVGNVDIYSITTAKLDDERVFHSCS